MAIIPPPPYGPPTPGDDDILGTPQPDAIHALAGNDRVFGLQGDDRLYGDAGDDVLDGGEGNDLLSGGDGDDILEGGSGDDRMIGGNGTDLMIGSEGNDIMYLANAGNRSQGDGVADKVFFFSEEAGADKVYGFESGIDTVELIGSEYTLTNNGRSSFLNFGSTTVTFYNEILLDSDIITI